MLSDKLSLERNPYLGKNDGNWQGLSLSASHMWRWERRIALKVCAELKWSKISLASAASICTLGARTSDAY